MAERREKVVLTLDDRFSAGMTRAAASAALLNRELEHIDSNGRLSGRALNNNTRHTDRLTQSTGRLTGSLRDTNGQLDRLGGNGRGGLGGVDRQADRASNSIDRLSGRLGILLNTAALVGPAFIPIGALAAPAVAGLTTQLGFAAAAGGTAILAFQGFGEAFKAINKSALEPTKENIEAARTAMEKLSPAATDFMHQLQSLSGAGTSLRNSASEGLFPGLSKSLDTIQTRVPQVERILFNLGSVLGDIAANGAASLASGRWDAFFNFFEQEARTTLTALAEAVGNLGHAFTNLIIQTAPLSHGFSDWLVEATARFDQFTAGIGKSNGFAEFIDYIQANGPQVAETVGAISMALLDVVEAAAPLAGPVLAGIEGVARVISLIADSPIGPVLYAAVAAMSALTLATRIWGSTAVTSARAAVAGQVGVGGALRTNIALATQFGATNLAQVRAQQAAAVAVRNAAIKAGAGIAGLALVSSGAADKIGLQNTAMFATAGLMVGGPWGAAIGGGIGLIADFAASNKDAEVDVAGLSATLDQQTGAITRSTTAQVAKNLADAGAVDAADKLGIAYTDVTLAAEGNAEAQGRIDAAIQSQLEAAQASSGVMSEQTGAMNGVYAAADKLTGAIDVNSAAIDKGQAGIKNQVALLGGYSNAASAAAQKTKNFSDAVSDLNNLLSERASLRDYEAALDAATEAAKKNGKTLDRNTAAGRENEAALDNIAATAIKVADNLGPLGKVRVMTRAHQDLVSAARQMGLTKAEANRLADELINLDKINAKPKITVNSGLARAEIAAIRGLLSAIPDENVNVNVTRHTNANIAEADRGYATGGMVRGPGTGTSDSIVARLSNGEHVTNAKATRNNAALLRDINTFGATRRFATGGTVGGKTMGVNRDYQSLSRGARDATDGMREVGKQSKAAAKELEKQKNELQALQQKAQSIRSGARGAFNNDAFGGSVTDLRTQLEADRNDARAATRALRRAKRKGLDGALATQIAQSGNVALAQQVAGMSRAEIRKLEQLYSQRASAQNGLGNQAVAMTRLNKEIANLRDEIRDNRHRAPKHEKAMEDAVFRGARDGIEGRQKQQNRRVAASSRTGR